MDRKNKRGVAGIDNLISAFLGFAIIAIIVVIAYLMVAQAQAQTTVNTSAYNGTIKVITAMDTLTSFLPIIALAIVLGVVLYLLFANLPRMSGGGGV